MADNRQMVIDLDKKRMTAMAQKDVSTLNALLGDEVPDPTAGPGEVVVDIHAASINAADYKVRLGGPGHNLKFPYILGRDFSGIVSALGTGVTDFRAGDAVFGVTDQGVEGCYAEKLAIKAAIIAVPVQTRRRKRQANPPFHYAER
jgi:NADPH:quinone reductase-like Zn-dependent oxidoreductase